MLVDVIFMLFFGLFLENDWQWYILGANGRIWITFGGELDIGI